MINLDEFEKEREILMSMGDYVPYEEFKKGEETIILTENGFQEADVEEGSIDVE